MKVNKLAILMGVAGLVYGTSSNAFYNVNAALTAPTSYDYSMTSNGFNFSYRSVNGASPSSIPLFTRTASSTFFNYTHNFANGQHSNTANYFLPQGLNVIMTFNRSNTSWTDGTPYTGYYPTDIKIGSDNTVGSISGKVDLTFNNQTNRNYRLYVDTSSMTELFYRYYVNDLLWDIDSYYYKNTSLTNILLPSFTKLRLELPETSAARYFDAWYLTDLGINGAYDDGYDDGYSDGENDVISSGGLQGIIEGVFNGIVAIFGIEIFNSITLGAVAMFPLIITLFIFVMKIVKMGG